MHCSPDHYRTLGLIPEASPEVIIAAYEALTRAYQSDTEESRAKLASVELAFEVLSDAEKRRKYDQGRAKQTINEFPDEFNPVSPFATNPVDEAWQVACRFHKNLDLKADNLQAISWRLAFVFKLNVIAERRFTEAEEISDALKTRYMTRYFGENSYIRSYAEFLILKRHYDAAFYVNEIVSIMGDTVNAYNLREEVESRYKIY